MLDILSEGPEGPQNRFDPASRGKSLEGKA
jgi:hypothetical protein